MRIYISGKISGDPNYRTKFYEIDLQLLRKGWKTLDPATLPDGLTKAQYMRIDINAILDCDAIFFLPDAMDSAGARIEWELAHYIGMTMYYHIDEVPEVGGVRCDGHDQYGRRVGLEPEEVRCVR